MKFSTLLQKRMPFGLRLLLFILILYFTGTLSPLLKGDVTATLTMPGSSYQGTLPPLSAAEKDTIPRLQEHIKQLTVFIGKRNIRHYDNLEKSVTYIADSFRTMGYEVKYQYYMVSGKAVCNIEASLTGSKKPEKILVIGAHYDSADTVAANDNGSGVAALLELARLLRHSNLENTVRFVAFTNEEPPYFQTHNMGSFVYAKRSYQQKETIRGMLSLETIGYYSDVAGSQHYPFPLNHFYPGTGNFIGFVGNATSKALVQETVRLFRETTLFPSEGAAITEYVRGIGWSDHWSFWQFGYPALMVTDTATYRYPFYHTKEDTIEKIDFAKMARVVIGLEKVIRSLDSARIKPT